jgi:hypothetical protein
LEQTILAENSLVQVLTAARASSVTYDSDSPLSITMETRVQPEQLLSIQNQLRATLQLSDPNNVNHAQKEVMIYNLWCPYCCFFSKKSYLQKFAKIILARTHFECGQYDDALEIIEQLSFEKEQVSQGYGLVLFLQARSIKGKTKS